MNESEISDFRRKEKDPHQWQHYICLDYSKRRIKKRAAAPVMRMAGVKFPAIAASNLKR